MTEKPTTLIWKELGPETPKRFGLFVDKVWTPMNARGLKKLRIWNISVEEPVFLQMTGRKLTFVSSTSEATHPFVSKKLLKTESGEGLKCFENFSSQQGTGRDFPVDLSFSAVSVALVTGGDFMWGEGAAFQNSQLGVCPT